MDSDSGNVKTIANKNLNHSHGNCQPLLALDNETVDTVVVGGIGGGALKKLNAAGIQVFRGISGSVSENINLLVSGKLPQFTMQQTCLGNHDGHCAH